MADYPLPELGGLTPLQYAGTPYMDSLARRGRLGTVQTIPSGLVPGSDVANLSLLGYDPARFYTGRAPLEAASMGIALREDDVVYRCNLVTLSEAPDYSSRVMLDHSAGDISAAEAGELVQEIQHRLADTGYEFYAGLGYRHLMVWRAGREDIVTTPPHDILDQAIGKYLPRGDGGEVLVSLMEQSSILLADHPVNRRRVAGGQPPANSCWLWGQGRRPNLPSFVSKYGLQGAVISAVDLVKGLGVCVGLKVVPVAGATGNIHTNFRGKARAALEQLEAGKDFIYLHVEAPDEAGHHGDVFTKIQAIEKIDAQVIGELLAGLENNFDFRLLVLPDHLTPVRLRTHVAEPVPFIFYDAARPQDGPAGGYSEAGAAASGWHLAGGPALMDYFIREGSHPCGL